MAKLINGNGNLAIYADEDADWFGSIFGDTTAITGIGNQFAYSLLDANTIGVQDGVIISKEGRRVQLNANEIDEFDIPTGAQGTTNYYIIGYRLYTDETSAQGCETFVELMDNGTDTIPEDTFRGGADEVYISLYRVKQVDLAITTVTLLLPTVSGIIQLNNDLAEISQKINTWNLLWTNTTPSTNFAAQTITLDLSDYNEINVIFAEQTDRLTNLFSYTLRNAENLQMCATTLVQSARGRIFKISSSGVEFLAGYSGSSTANNIAIPYYIYAK